MTCESIVPRLSLYLYGELPGEEEEQLEAHLEGCAVCRKEFATRKAVLRAIDMDQPEIPETLLTECRMELRETIARAASLRNPPRTLPRNWGWLAETFGALGGWFGGFRVPVAASALIAVGFFGARLTAPAPGVPPRPAEPAALMSAVRSVETTADGRVQIALDETRRRTVTGAISDAGIRALLLAALREEADPGVRMESMDLLKAQSVSSREVREALIGALIHDPDETIRLKAFEGLKQSGSDAGTRKAMLYALTADQNSGLRVQAIDMLTGQQDRELVGVWQALLEREQDPYIRMRCRKELQAMNASVGTF